MSRAQESPAPKSSPVASLDGIIHTIRSERVILDADLAVLYGVRTKALNQAVRRNEARFPSDFMFQLTPEELANLKSQIVISSFEILSWLG